MTFHVGMKVVRVRSGLPSQGDQSLPDLTIGNIYTIRDVDQRTVLLHGAPTIRLEEVIGRILHNTTVGDWECGYHPAGFRPVTERKTDISIFTAMLTDKREPAHA